MRGPSQQRITNLTVALEGSQELVSLVPPASWTDHLDHADGWTGRLAMCLGAGVHVAMRDGVNK